MTTFLQKAFIKLKKIVANSPNRLPSLLTVLESGFLEFQEFIDLTQTCRTLFHSSPDFMQVLNNHIKSESLEEKIDKIADAILSISYKPTPQYDIHDPTLIKTLIEMLNVTETPRIAIMFTLENIAGSRDGAKIFIENGILEKLITLFPRHENTTHYHASLERIYRTITDSVINY